MAFCVSRALYVFGSSACGILYKSSCKDSKIGKSIAALLLVSFIPFVQYFLGINYYCDVFLFSRFISLGIYSGFYRCI